MRGEWIKRNEPGAPVVVFVHGVLSSGETCWRHESGAYWPNIVAKDLELAALGVYVFSYRTGFFTGTYSLGNAVDALKEHMRLDGVLNANQVIFVCHSMGGILVRKYLVQRASELIDNNVRIGLFLIASPSLGSDYANWLAPLARFFGHSQADVLRFAQTNAWLMDLDGEFLNLKEGRRLQLHGKELIEDQFIWLRWLWRKQVVPPFAGAKYFGEPFKVPGSDHLSIAKIESPEAIQHRLLSRFILDWIALKEEELLADRRRNVSLPPLTLVQHQTIVMDDPVTNVSGGTVSEASRSRKAWEGYRNRVIAKATANDWWLKPIPIVVTEKGRPARSARDAIQDWISSAEARHCVLLGEPGAGKTGLLTWTASIITECENSVALWVSAKRLRELQDIELPGMLGLCDPALPEDIACDTESREIFFVLDGLDELTGAAEGGEAVAAALLRRALDQIPLGWRVIASCRTPAFDALRDAIEEALPRRQDAEKNRDHYDAAIARALGLERRSVALIHIARVQASAASTYLESADLPKSVVEELMDDEQWWSLLSSPFLLRLARLVLPTLIRGGPPTLDRLYDTYTRAALFREDHDLSDAQLAATLNDLTQFSNFIDRRRRIRDPELALRADLLRQRDDEIDFTHYSLWEYFFARHLRSEILRMSARTLAHVDLIAAYNVNRMLVPMLLRDVAERAPGDGSARLVTPDEYLEFANSTKWRGSTGYGRHPARSGGEAEVPASTFKFDYSEALAIHRNDQHGRGNSPVACAVSWYDAVTFALWRGVRLPTSQELIEARPCGTHLLWCSDWHEEDVAHIAVFDMETGAMHGLNPDVRLPRTALAIVDPAVVS